MIIRIITVRGRIARRRDSGLASAKSHDTLKTIGNGFGRIIRAGSIGLAGITTFLLARDIGRTRSLPTVHGGAPLTPTRVSVLVPARNEAHRIGRLLAGLAQQTSQSFEAIVLDDHSDDGTGDIVRAARETIPTLRLMEGRALPVGWSGKCWACWQAAGEATAPWLLFLDADTAPQPELIAALVAHAEAQCLDLLTVVPLVETETFWERILIPPFGVLIQVVFPPAAVNDPRSRLAMANGPCILVRRAVYAATGGHATVRASILEDVELGALVKHAGFRLAIANAPDLIRVRLYTRFAEISEGLQKNAWAGYRAGGWRSAWMGVRQLTLALTPWVLLGAATATRTADRRWLLANALYAACVNIIFWCWYVRRVHRIAAAWGALVPAGVVGYFALAGRAWLRLRRGQGVTWKGRAYRNIPAA